MLKSFTDLYGISFIFSTITSHRTYIRMLFTYENINLYTWSMHFCINLKELSIKYDDVFSPLMCN